jgi:hypothetical protein
LTKNIKATYPKLPWVRWPMLLMILFLARFRKPHSIKPIIIFQEYGAQFVYQSCPIPFAKARRRNRTGNHYIIFPGHYFTALIA